MDLWECYKHSVFLCHQELGDDINFAIISAQNPHGHIPPSTPQSASGLPI